MAKSMSFQAFLLFLPSKSANLYTLALEFYLNGIICKIILQLVLFALPLQICRKRTHPIILFQCLVWTRGILLCTVFLLRVFLCTFSLHFREPMVMTWLVPSCAFLCTQTITHRRTTMSYKDNLLCHSIGFYFSIKFLRILYLYYLHPPTPPMSPQTWLLL